MISDILWTFILIVFAFTGLKRPYIALSGVIFVDILKPQSLSFSFLAGKPVSFAMTLILLFSMILNFNQISKPKSLAPIFLLIVFLCWITITTFNAEFQFAWIKFNYVFKTILFSLFIPFILNSRIKIDTFIAILVSSISFYTIALGMTTLAGGGGYGKVLFHMNTSNTGMAESSTMAMVAVLNIPLIIYLSQSSVFKHRIKYLPVTSKLLIFASLLSVVGTAARTGLVGLLAYAGLIISRTKHKFRFASALILAVAIFIPFAPQQWLNRMETITSAEKDSSAYGRIVVWKWTIDYVNSRPIFGGGFLSHMANAGQLYKYIDEDINISHTQTGKAYHNIFFEVLGEQGYVGLFIYLSIVWYTYKNTAKLKKLNTPLDAEWLTSAATAIQDALILYCICGMFIGVAYYPWVFYFFTLTISMVSQRDKIKGF